MASLTKDTELQMKESKKKLLLEPQAKPLSELEQHLIKSTKVITEWAFWNKREVPGTLLRSKKKWATDTHNSIDGSQNTLCLVKKACYKKTLYTIWIRSFAILE